MIRRLGEIEKFLKTTEFAGAGLQPLAGDASARRYVRALKDGKKAMIMDTPAEGENFLAFVTIAEYLQQNGYSAPQIIARDMEKGFLLLEDFGDDSFTKILRQNEGKEEALYSAAIDLLAKWHNKQTLPLPPYNEEVYLREVSLFSDWYLVKVLGEGKALPLREEYIGIWKRIFASFPLAQNSFVHRDYHADNLMWLPEKDNIKRVGLLDFQDALLGDPAYDLVSLLEDARRDVSVALVDKMIARYIAATGVDTGNFHTAYNIIGAQRNSKIIGIFVRLCMRDGKNNYLSYLPRVWKHLERDVKHPLLAELKSWIDRNIPSELRSELSA